MKPRIVVKYRKVSNKRLPIAGYKLGGYRMKSGKSDITLATIKADPLLRKKKNAKLARVIIKHESDESTARSKGLSRSKAHQVARNKEPKWFHDKTHKQILRDLMD
jgi:hypothetical protein